MNPSTQLGATIRARRVNREMTRAELSRVSGLSPSFLYRIERGLRSPSDIALVKLARALGCTVDDLTGTAAAA